MDEVRATIPNLALKVRDLSKSFGSYLALRGLDLDVEYGESLVIFGPNGAGKTTLIKVLATVMNPSSGDVSVNGMSLKEQPEAIRRRIGVVTHQTYLYNNLTCYENLEFYCRMYDIPKNRINEVVAMVDMNLRLHERVGTLSRGMQQRVSIARAFLHQPSIMMLDEPETGLDQQATTLLWRLLKGTGDDSRTVIMTTHNLEHGLEHSDRIIILNRGQIVYEQKSKELNLTGLKKTYSAVTGLAA